jgi:hypothetical protein
MGSYPPLDWCDRFRFGKYKGLTVADVASFNPFYLTWAIKNVPGFDLTAEARKLGQRQLNLHEQQSMNRQEGWAWGFGRAVKSAANSWRGKMVELEMAARRRAAEQLNAAHPASATGPIDHQTVGPDKDQD